MVVMKKTMKALALIVAVVVAATATAQDQQAAAPDTRVIPRNEFGHISFAGSKENPGNWNGLLGSLANRQPNQRGNIPENMPYDQVPFQDWAREEHAARTALGGANDPHTRCKPSGGARMFHTPYGMEILDVGDTVFMMGVGSPHSWRQIHMDGRAHPANPDPGFYGHSVGHWEGDTLVVDTVGIAEGVLSPPTRNSTRLHVEERYTLDTTTMALVRNYRAEDPVYLAQPWIGRDTVLLSEVPFEKQVCKEMTPEFQQE